MPTKKPTIPRNVAQSLGHYVYLYIDPKTKKIVYVGKGKGNRAFAHIDGPHEVEILIHGLPDEATAHAVETAAIDLLGLKDLDNRCRGHGCERGRMGLDQILSLYQKKPARITEPAILIRINQLYRYGMTEVELYDATRGIWKVNPSKRRPEYAFAIYQDVIREVYKIAEWLQAGSTFSTRSPRDVRDKKRKEFVGTIAPERVRKKYLGRSVTGYFAKHNQNPIHFVNC